MPRSWERSPRVPRTLNTRGHRPLDPVADTLQVVLLEDKSVFASGKVHFMERLLTLPWKLERLRFRSRAGSAPSRSLSLLRIPVAGRDAAS